MLAKENILQAQARQKMQHDRKHVNAPNFQVGTHVLKKYFTRKRRRGGKLDSKWLGHYTIEANIHCPTGVVDVYDSMPSCSIGSHDLTKQLATILRCSAKCMYVRYVNVQRQSGISDCGIFAIAFAAALCMGIDPYTLNIDQKESRTHLLNCFEQKKMKAFPLTERPRRITAKRVAVTKRVKLFCLCRMPYKKD